MQAPVTKTSNIRLEYYLRRSLKKDTSDRNYNIKVLRRIEQDFLDNKACRVLDKVDRDFVLMIDYSTGKTVTHACFILTILSLAPTARKLI